MDVAKKLGWSGLWAGLVPRIVMIGTLTAAQWFIYDAVKVFFRMPRKINGNKILNEGN